MKIVLKVLGLLLVSLSMASAQDKTPPPAGILTSQSGRFVFGQINDSYRHIYMLDTQTGRLWHAVYNNDGSEMTLAPIQYKREDGSKSVFPDGVIKPMPPVQKPLHQKPQPEEPGGPALPKPRLR